jgi:AraC-like DNA-binding protein
MINSQFYVPTPPLRRYIKYFMAGQVEDQGDLPENHEIFPLNLTAITFLESPGVFYFNNQSGSDLIPASPITFVGPMTYKGVTQFHKTGKMITTVFTVVGLYAFFGFPINEIADTAGNGVEIIEDPDLKGCREDYFNAASIEESIGILENYFLGLVEKNEISLRNIDEVAQFINIRKGNVNMDWLIRQANMSIKTFERHFYEKIGLAPKLFSRIVRFSHAMKMIDQKSDIFDIIVSCGYVDQAHFIKEVKNFAGNTPKYYYDGLNGIPKLFIDNYISA